MMGGEQSQEKKAEEREDEPEKQQEPVSAESSGSAASEDTPGELPQCRMGNRKVDNMCFMISCTNWY
ncbi:skin secretory protein xP2-like isoform X1 [Lates japonicus]